MAQLMKGRLMESGHLEEVLHGHSLQASLCMTAAPIGEDVHGLLDLHEQFPESGIGVNQGFVIECVHLTLILFHTEIESLSLELALNVELCTLGAHHKACHRGSMLAMKFKAEAAGIRFCVAEFLPYETWFKQR